MGVVWGKGSGGLLKKGREGVMLVVGAVSETTARVMVYNGLHVPLEGHVVGTNVFFSLPPSVDAPHVVKFVGLKKSTLYRVEFGSSADVVEFHTPPMGTSQPIAVHSCDASRLDGDEGFLKAVQRGLGWAIGGVEDVALQPPLPASSHLPGLKLGIGDNSYHDGEFFTAPQASYETAKRWFREAYLEAWSSTSRQAWFRKNPTLMLPDDHDIVNNLAPHHFRGHRSAVAKAGAAVLAEFQLRLLGEEFGTQSDVVVQVGEQQAVVVENNHSLTTSSQHAPWPLEDGAVRGMGGMGGRGEWDVRPYFALKWGKVGIIAVDIRVERAVQGAEELLSVKQMGALLRDLRALEHTKGVEEILVATSVPLLVVDKWMALGPRAIQNDEYPTFAHHVVATSALLNILGAVTKRVTLVAGDLHMSIQGTVCPNQSPHPTGDWMELLRPLLTSATIPWPSGKWAIKETLERDLLDDWKSAWELVDDALTTITPTSPLTSLLYTPNDTTQAALTSSLATFLSPSPSPPLSRCIPAITSSGISHSASVLSSRQFTLFATLARHWSNAFAGSWHGKITDIWGGSNLLLFFPPSSSNPKTLPPAKPFTFANRWNGDRLQLHDIPTNTSLPSIACEFSTFTHNSAVCRTNLPSQHRLRAQYFIDFFSPHLVLTILLLFVPLASCTTFRCSFHCCNEEK